MPATTTSFPRPRTCTIRRPGLKTRCSGPPTREKFRALTHLGLTDAHPRQQRPTRALYVLGLSGRRLAEKQGIRIDHLLLSPRAADRLTGAGIDKHVRDWEKPSDHVPVWIDWISRTAVSGRKICVVSPGGPSASARDRSSELHARRRSPAWRRPRASRRPTSRRSALVARERQPHQAARRLPRHLLRP